MVGFFGIIFMRGNMCRENLRNEIHLQFQGWDHIFLNELVEILFYGQGMSPTKNV